MGELTLKRALACALLVCAFILPVCTRADEILVSAAASLTDAFNEIGKSYSGANRGTIVRFNFGASGALQQQILQGAPVDVFASASPKEMDALQREGRILPATRADFAANRLVLIAPPGSRLKSWSDLRAAPVRRIAISNPDSVPSGRYAKDTLTRRGLWNLVQPKAIFGENVRQTLTYVTGGNVDAGIVFATDQKAEGRRARVVDSAIPGQDHSPIVYPAAVLKSTTNRATAEKFVQFLRGPAAGAILARYGFQLIGGSAASHTPPSAPVPGSNARPPSKTGKR